MTDKPPTHLAVPIERMQLARHLISKLPGPDEEALAVLLFPAKPGIILPIAVDPETPAPAMP